MDSLQEIEKRINNFINENIEKTQDEWRNILNMVGDLHRNRIKLDQIDDPYGFELWFRKLTEYYKEKFFKE